MKIKVTLTAGHKFRSFECRLDDEEITDDNINWALQGLMEQLGDEFMPDDYDYFTPPSVSGVDVTWEEYDQWMESDE